MAFGQVGESMVPVGDSNGAGVVNSNDGSGAGWAGQYDPSVAGRWSLMSEDQSNAAWFQLLLVQCNEDVMILLMAHFLKT